jgi:hypothetical protein
MSLNNYFKKLNNKLKKHFITITIIKTKKQSN